MASRSPAGFWSQWWRLGGILGIGAILLIIIGIAVQGETPYFDSPIGEIRNYFTEDATQYLVGDYLLGLGFVFLFLPFLLSLRALLGWVEGGANVWSWLAFTGGLLMVAFLAAAGLSWGALALGAAADPEVSDSSVRALMYVNAYGLSGFVLAAALLLFPSSVIIWRTGVLWRWLALLGAAAGVLGVIGAAWVLDGDQKGALGILALISIFGFLLWVLLVSVNVLLKRELPARATSHQDPGQES